MLLICAGLMGGMGLVSILSRRSFLGVMIGVQVLLMGATLIFVAGGTSSGANVEGHLSALLVALGGVAQLVGGYAIAIRMFYLKSRTRMDELRSLKQ